MFYEGKVKWHQCQPTLQLRGVHPEGIDVLHDMMDQNKWKADSKLTVVMSAEHKDTYIIVDGVHRYYALARHIERSEARGQGTFMHEFDIPAIILRSETPQSVLTAMPLQ